MKLFRDKPMISLSVIIPNYNGSEYIPKLFVCLEKQTFDPNKFEVIFVDNGSSDDSTSLAKQFGFKLRHLKVFIYNDTQSSYDSRNFGVKHCRSNNLVFTDVDCQPSPQWLEIYMKKISNISGEWLLSGAVELFPKANDFNAYEWIDKCTALNQEKYSKEQTGATANLAVCIKSYNRVNGFSSVKSGGDLDFCRRVCSDEAVTYEYLPNAIVLHPTRASLSEMLNKHYRLSEGHARLNYRNKKTLQRFVYLAKIILSVILLPNEWRIIGKTIKTKDRCIFWTFKFALATLHLGFLARCRLVKEFVHLMIKQ